MSLEPVNVNLPARHRLPAEPLVCVPHTLAGESPLILLQAPAGFGKSEYLRQYFSQYVNNPTERSHTDPAAPQLPGPDHAGPPGAVWIALQPGDSDQQLLTLLLHLDGSPQARLWREQAQVQWQSDSGYCGLLRTWLALLDQASARCCVCIDDLHWLDESGWQLIAALIRGRPQGLQLVLAARYVPASLQSALTGGEALLVGTDLLQWSASATHGWLQQQGYETTAELEQQLQQRFHGWPAALSIWNVCLRAAGGLAAAPAPLSLAGYELQDYWLTEVVAGVSSLQRRLLQQVGVLGDCSEGLLSELNEQPCLEEITELIRRQLLQAADSSHWVRLRPALTEPAISSCTEQQRTAWHAAAFEWHSRHRQPVLALQHARLAGQHLALADWIEQQAESLLASLDIAGLVAWCDRVGDDVLRQSPRLMQLACWAWLLTYRVRRAESLLRWLVQNNSLDAMEQAALQGYLARLKGHHRSAASQCRKALEALPQERFGVRFLLASTLTYLSLSDTDLDTARAWNRHAFVIARQYGSLTLEALAMFEQARIELQRGHWSFSLGLIDNGITLLDKVPEHLAAMPLGRLTLYRAFLLWLTGRDRARLLPLLDQGIRLCRASGDVLVTYGYGLRAMELAATGHTRQALDAIDEVERLLHAWGVDFEGYSWMLLVKANIWIAQQKYHRVRDALDELTGGKPPAQMPRPEIFPLLPDFAAATRVRLDLAGRRYDDCLHDIDDWMRCQSSPMIKCLIQLLRAAALRGKNQIAESQHLFTRSMRQLREEGVELHFQAWLPELYPSDDSPSEKQPTLASVQLSEREHDVLRKIAEGCSNQEIASQLYISLHTVKSHARKINVKLGVSNRTQAIHRARELLLL